MINNFIYFLFFIYKMLELAVFFKINNNSENIRTTIIEYLNTISNNKFSEDIYDNTEHLYFNITNNDYFEQIIQFLDDIVYNGQNNIFQSSDNPIRYTIDKFESDEIENSMTKIYPINVRINKKGKKITTLKKTKYTCLKLPD